MELIRDLLGTGPVGMQDSFYIVPEAESGRSAGHGRASARVDD